jgi:hypothetical protein
MAWRGEREDRRIWNSNGARHDLMQCKTLELVFVFLLLFLKAWNYVFFVCCLCFWYEWEMRKVFKGECVCYDGGVKLELIYFL